MKIISLQISKHGFM